jgi:hypothetical protein
MQQRNEKDSNQKERQFTIEKLEQRIAPRHHCGVLAEVPAHGAAAAGLAIARANSGCGA